jgi:dTDP-glucose pyrophosphorylase
MMAPFSPLPALIVPMAGRGSRFAALGIHEPKPLIDLGGRPFFWWATQSVLHMTAVRRLVFVVLEEHVRDHAINRRIDEFYPEAELVVLPDVTSGAAETALAGLQHIEDEGAVVINDCDHAFICPAPGIAGALAHGASGALMCFRSADPAYSYACLDEAGRVVGTVEKQVVSPFAIAGCYGFGSAREFRAVFEDYSRNCGYDELFVSGLYNVIIGRGDTVEKTELERHLSFGTPAERARITPEDFSAFKTWL